MKIKLLPILLFAFSSNAQAPVFHWAKRAGSVGYETGMDIVLDSQQNVITVGSFNADTDFDPGPGTFVLSGLGNNDGFIQKLDKDGNFLWAKQISGDKIESVHKVALDAAGNIYLVGEYNGTVDFNPGPATFFMTSTTHTNPGLKSIDVFIVKLTPNGNFLWAKSFGGPEYDAVTDMDIDAQGNIILAGFFKLTSDFDPGAGTSAMTSAGMSDLYFSKLDTDGNLIWSRQIGGAGDDRMSCMSVDASGNIYATGYYYGPVDFNPGVGTFTLSASAPDPQNGQAQDVYVTKLDSDGNFVWASKFGGTKGEFGNTLAIDPIDNVYVSGIFYGSVDFDPGANDFTLDSPLASMYLAKLDSSGNFAWARKFTGTSMIEPMALKLDAGSNIYIGGTFYQTAIFGTAPEFSVTASGSEVDVFFAKFDSSGDAQWVKSIGGTSDDDLQEFKIQPDGSLYATGSFLGTADFNPDAGNFDMSSAGSGDLFVLRLSPENLSLPETENQLQIVAFSNPSMGIVNISVPAELVGAKARVYDAAGRKIIERELASTVSQLNLGSGVYFIEVSASDKKRVLKVVVN